MIIIMLFSVAGCNKKTAKKDVKNPTKKTVQKKEKNETSEELDEEELDEDTAEEIAEESATKGDSNQQASGNQSVSAQPASQQSSGKGVQSAAKSGSALTIEGPGVKNAMSFTVSDLKGMSQGLVSDSYFSLGRGAVEEYTDFKGVSLWYLLNKAGLQSNASKVIVKGDDGYTKVFTLNEVKKDDYISQNDPSKRYKMIIAFSEDGKEYDSAEGNPFRLAVGQVGEMDFNKLKWVRYVKTIRVE